MRPALFLLAVLALAGCESEQPMTKTGEVLDHAGTATGNAVTTGAKDTGQALDKAGTYVKNKVDPNP